MAEIKNTFLRSKMNKDLDDRLIPNGEYRDAQNISVGKSEDADVGALENIIGNANITSSLPYDSSCEIIGYFSDNSNNKIITFVTNYTDPNPSSPTYVSDANKATPTPSPLNECHICIYDQNNPGYQKIVSGEFLNFSTTNKVLGVSLIENLLFFTDNRNQPRKINVETAISNPSYYNTEDTISVAKYNPYESISLLKKVKGKTTAATTSGSTITLESVDGIEQGMFVTAVNDDEGIAIQGLDFVTVASINSTTKVVTLQTQVGATTTPVSASVTVTDNAIVTFLKSTMTNEEDVASWPGDPDLLEDKYVRFSYRFKFDDGEYSLMAPFTQIAYVPKQKGYFNSGDEDASYRSTILDFMENEMNNMELLIPLPSKGTNLEEEYKITSIDVLYKESDALTVKVLETLPIGKIPATDLQTNIYSYQYQSRKPYKTLPQAETTRVYDKVPVRALSQETSGNRVMYGNFYDKYSSLDSIDYYVGTNQKNTTSFDSWVEYPNHTLKQNRNYQVGFILADKFGRQTPVILSPVDLTGINSGTVEFKGGSTIYHPYYDSSTQPNIQQWFGDAIQVVVQNKISNGVNDKNTLSEAGLYAVQYQDPTKSGVGFSISSATFNSVDQKEITFILNTSFPNNASLPRVGDYLRGQYRDYVKVTNVSLGPTIITADGAISDSYLHKEFLTNDIKFAYTVNQIGWYSYKVVVKQTEQEYYNCYLPGILNGYPSPQTGAPAYPTGETNKTAHIVLLNDNINKIPRDLSEIGPDQKQYRSSVQLFGRVQNNSATQNTQYFPARTTDTVSTIATANDLNMSSSDISSISNFYQLDTNPLIGRISTLSQAIGVTESTMVPILAVYETEPVNSLLDIFWETTTTGLISDLNEDILTGSNSPVSLSPIGFSFLENQDPNGSGTGTGSSNSPYVTDVFYPVSPEGNSLTNTTYVSFTATDNNNPTNNLGEFFIIEQDTVSTSPTFGSYRIRLNNNPFLNFGYTYFSKDYLTNNSYNFSLSIRDTSNDIVTFNFTGSLTNVDPYLSQATPPLMNQPSSPLSLITVQQVGDSGNSLQIGDLGSPVNGAFRYSPEAISQVGVFFTSVPPVPTTEIADSVTINHETAIAFRGYEWSEGYYTLGLKVKDALLSFNSGQNGISSQPFVSSGTNTSILYEQPVRVVPGTCNLNTSCQVDPASGTREQSFATTTTSTPYKNYGWRFGSASGGNPVDPSDSLGFTDVQEVSIDGLKNGTVLFDLMVETESNSITTLNGNFKWRIWYRSNSSSTWTLNNVIDTNGVDLNTSNGTVSSNGWIDNAGQDLECQSTTTSGNKSQIHIPIALSKKGEYFIQVRGYKNGDYGDATCWVNATDANYPSCVPQEGVNTISGTGRDADYFEYNLTTNSSNLSCPSDALDKTAYARTPYAHVISQLFTDTALTTGYSGPWTSNEYNSYIYNPQTPANSITTTKYSAQFENDVINPSNGRTIKGIVKNITGIDRINCDTSGTFQGLQYRVYYNINY